MTFDSDFLPMFSLRERDLDFLLTKKIIYTYIFNLSSNLTRFFYQEKTIITELNYDIKMP